MNKEEVFFQDWEENKKQLNKLPENEQTIVTAMQTNDGILKAFVLYLAVMW